MAATEYEVPHLLPFFWQLRLCRMRSPPLVQDCLPYFSRKVLVPLWSVLFLRCDHWSSCFSPFRRLITQAQKLTCRLISLSLGPARLFESRNKDPGRFTQGDSRDFIIIRLSGLRRMISFCLCTAYS